MLGISYMLGFLILYQFPSYGYEYCAYQEELCKEVHHVACVAEQHSTEDQEPVVPVIVSKMREAIINQHNYYRNEVACGKVFDKADLQYPTAAKMHELTWDFELEYLAKTMTSECIVGETYCQNTFRFRNVGQNLGVVDMAVKNRAEMKPAIHLEEQIDSWFEKHIIVNVSQINNFHIKGFEYIDFVMYAQRTSYLLMVSDQVKQLGCGISYCRQDNAWNIHVVCNYSKDLIFGKPVYKTGEPASDCEMKSEKFPCLCAGETKSIHDYENPS